MQKIILRSNDIVVLCSKKKHISRLESKTNIVVRSTDGKFVTVRTKKYNGTTNRYCACGPMRPPKKNKPKKEAGTRKTKRSKGT